MEVGTGTASRDLSEAVAMEIRIELLRRDWSQADLAERMGKTEMWVSRRVKPHGKRQEIGLNEYAAFAKALGMTPQRLIELAAQDGSIAQTIRRPERPRRAAVRTMVPATAERLTARVPTTQPETSQRATRLAVA